MRSKSLNDIGVMFRKLQYHFPKYVLCCNLYSLAMGFSLDGCLHLSNCPQYQFFLVGDL